MKDKQITNGQHIVNFAAKHMRKTQYMMKNDQDNILKELSLLSEYIKSEKKSDSLDQFYLTRNGHNFVRTKGFLYPFSGLDDLANLTKFVDREIEKELSLTSSGDVVELEM